MSNLIIIPFAYIEGYRGGKSWKEGQAVNHLSEELLCGGCLCKEKRWRK